jgi:hypothetical protein
LEEKDCRESSGGPARVFDGGVGFAASASGANAWTVTGYSKLAS